MIKKYYFFVFFVYFLQPCFTHAIGSVGIGIQYVGDLQGNGDISGNILCAYDTHNIRFQTELLLQNNKIKPQFTVLPLHNPDASMNLRTLTNSQVASINASTQIAFHLLSLHYERQYKHPMLEASYIDSCEHRIKDIDKNSKHLEQYLKQKNPLML